MTQLSWTQILCPTQDEKAEGPNQQMKQYCVYIMTNQSGTLYTGVTNALTRRIYEQQAGRSRTFHNEIPHHTIIVLRRNSGYSCGTQSGETAQRLDARKEAGID
ncbi:MAG: GIY-YIG nuclease family protein [Nitrospira sp.]|nr:GIY-YIG nuclease family protein [Nitrospira sp.]